MNHDKNLCKDTTKTGTKQDLTKFSNTGNLFRLKVLLKINVQHTLEVQNGFMCAAGANVRVSYG